jgi:hypothetical protein
MSPDWPVSRLAGSAVEKHAAEELAAAQRAVEEARASLVSPLLNSSGMTERLLWHAVCSLRNCGTLLAQLNAGEKARMVGSARALKLELVRLSAVADHTMSFCGGWMALLGGMQSGYTGSGMACPPKPAPRLELEA